MAFRVLALLLFLGTVSSASAFGAELAPHRAAYSLSLAAAKVGSNISGATGVMEVEFVVACEGYYSRQALQLTLLSAGGPASTTQFAAILFERTDAAELTFETNQFAGAQLSEAFAGRAIHAAGKPGTIRYERPTGLNLNMPANTLFPVEGTVKLLDAAAAGDAFLAGNLFDGGGPDALSAVSAIIAGAIAADRDLPAAGAAALAGRRSWRGQIAHYPIAAAAATPAFEEGYRLYAGGIIDELDLNYGTFRLKGTLTKLELVPRPAC